MDIDNTNKIKAFREKEKIDGSRINAGYMVAEPQLFDYLEDDYTILEQQPLHQLAQEGQLSAYPFDGYWQCMDTKRENDKLNELWKSGNAPWKVWK